MNKFNTLQDLRRFVGDCMPSDLSCYTCTYDEIVDSATECLLEDIKRFKCKWGEDLPEGWFEDLYGLDHSGWWEIFEDQ